MSSKAFVLALLGLVACQRPTPRVLTTNNNIRVIQQDTAHIPGTDASVVSPTIDPNIDYAPRIDSEAVWSVLAAAPQHQLASRTEVIKVVIDLEDNNKIYFLQTKHWEIHYYFIQKFLNRPDKPIPEAEAFWQREYLSLNRRFIEASLVRYRDQNILSFELIAQDVLDLDRTVRAFQLVKSSLFNGDQLRYHPVPAHHIRDIATLQRQIPVVTTDDLFANTRYQPLNPGEAFGYLRFFDGPVDPSRVRPYDVVVLAQVPLDLPVCAGVITSELQTPLSHIAVLSANRNTPNMALRNANHDTALRALEGQIVRLHVTPQDYTVTPATQAQAEAAWNAHRPSTEFHPRRSDRASGLLGLERVGMNDIDVVGAKAAQLGELTQIRPALRVPRGFSVPFHAYTQHLRSAGLLPEIQRMLADPAFVNDSSVRERTLQALREKIIQAPVDTALVRTIRTEIMRRFPTMRVRYRSSTNAEDLPGFNGAGLYLSTSTDAAPSETQIADALRRVWASTWNFQGFEERSYYRIHHEEVAMSILVQESIDDDVATGVAITGNPFDEGRPGYFINSQVSAGSVTSASSGEVPEQLIWYTYPPPGFLERVSSSSRTSGAPVLSDNEARSLSQALTQIQEHFFGPGSFQTPQVMDVEFLIAGPDRHVVVVQARPYTMHWDEGRGWSRPPE